MTINAILENILSKAKIKNRDFKTILLEITIYKIAVLNNFSIM